MYFNKHFPIKGSVFHDQRIDFETRINFHFHLQSLRTELCKPQLIHLEIR
jgi:hypothetical protein